GFVQTVWMSPEAPIHCIRYEAEADRLLAGVGGKGAVYEIRENGQATRLSQVEQRNVIAMAAAKKLVYIGTAESGVVYTMSGAEGLQGVYISRPLDGDDPVQWGSLRIRANAPEGTSITLAVRQGNTEDPSDKTWTAWSAEQAPVDQQVKVGGRPTRFLQYRVTLGRAAIDSPLPTLDTVEAFYLTPNLAPVIKEVKVSTRPGRGGPSSLGAPKPPSSSSGGAPTPPTSRPPSLPMPSPGGEAGGGGAGGREGASVAVSPNSNEQSVQVSWNVDEPNDDQTQVDVLFKGEKETVWRKLNTEPIRGTSNYRFDSGTIPDGDYRARVAVSDLPSNPPDIAKTTNLDSEVFTIDNTAPKIDQLKVAATKDGKYRLTASAHDAATMIASARFKIDAAEWRLAFPADGIFDSPTETFDFGVSLPKPGEHNVALMVVDREGNTTVAKRTVVAK
ncbi:MAG: hypothetical protein NTW86_07205, partial [Candidatus Sumerlaeota bacterium]|nr:hypothetical protein [Candidatus Sumerlaeota bacterium]